MLSTGSPVAVTWHRALDAAEVLRVAAGCAAIAVDIPIGLPTGAEGRPADEAARRALSPRGSCVFSAPVRAVLEATSYADACARSRAVSGKAISQQAWHISDKIRQWDALVTPALQSRVVEAHPEMAFLRMLADRPGDVVAPLPPKRRPAGRAARLAALARWLPDPADVLASRPRTIPAEDAIDALACAWTAQRWASRTAELLPPNPPWDVLGRWVGIVA